jgi:hypothetical protein
MDKLKSGAVGLGLIAAGAIGSLTVQGALASVDYVEPSKVFIAGDLLVAALDKATEVAEPESMGWQEFHCATRQDTKQHVCSVAAVKHGKTVPPGAVPLSQFMPAPAPEPSK